MEVLDALLVAEIPLFELADIELVVLRRDWLLGSGHLDEN